MGYLFLVVPRCSWIVLHPSNYCSRYLSCNLVLFNIRLRAFPTLSRAGPQFKRQDKSDDDISCCQEAAYSYSGIYPMLMSFRKDHFEILRDSWRDVVGISKLPRENVHAPTDIDPRLTCPQRRPVTGMASVPSQTAGCRLTLLVSLHTARLTPDCSFRPSVSPHCPSRRSFRSSPFPHRHLSVHRCTAPRPHSTSHHARRPRTALCPAGGADTPPPPPPPPPPTPEPPRRSPCSR